MTPAMLIPALLAPWLAAGLLAIVVRSSRPIVGRATAALGLVSLAAAVGLWSRALADEATFWGPGGLFRVDALSAFMAFCVAAVGEVAMILAPGQRGLDDEARLWRRFRIYGSVFIFAMLAAVTINNVALMWVAIEATTVTSALLIPLRRSKASVEASWKYILIGSVGIALAFAGTVLAYFDFVSLMGRRHDALDWTLLVSAAPSMHPDVLRLAFVFLVVGYGTKAGLAPMHTWLPDAHSEGPAPLSAMMSGVLLAVAQYAILRWKTVVDLAVAPAFTNNILVGFGLLSLTIGAFGLVIQRNYKRMLAYSSVEHAGLICLGLTFGPAGVFAAMLHVLNHALAKTVGFLTAGRILQRFGSTDVDRVSGLVRTMPATGALFAASVFALMGLPPFGILVSEFLLFRAGFLSGHIWTTAAALALAGIGFVGLGRLLLGMLFGPAIVPADAGERDRWDLVPLAVCVAALAVLGLWLPGAVDGLIGRIVAAVTV